MNKHDNARNTRVQVVKAMLDEFPDLRQWVKEYLKEYLKSVAYLTKSFVNKVDNS